MKISIEQRTTTLPDGDYWIGDPCYVLGHMNDVDWRDLLKETGMLGLEDLEGQTYPRNKQHGVFKLGGHLIAVSSTAYGDGCYQDQEFNRYPVDAGMLSAIPMDFIKEYEGDYDLDLGATHVLVGAKVKYVKGTISFGDVSIKTGH